MRVCVLHLAATGMAGLALLTPQDVIYGSGGFSVVVDKIIYTRCTCTHCHTQLRIQKKIKKLRRFNVYILEDSHVMFYRYKR